MEVLVKGLKRRMRIATSCLIALLLSGLAPAQERLPQQVAGTWRISRILPVAANACWTEKEAQPLVGSLLQYSSRQMRWRGGVVPLTGITTRTVTSEDLLSETSDGKNASINLADLGIRAKKVTEVNFQHEDADVTGATTEVPGDSVLVAGPGRIVVSACGIYMEARRVSSSHAGTAEPQDKGL